MDSTAADGRGATRRLARLLACGLAATLGAAGADAVAGPLGAPIVKDGRSALLVDFVQIPPSSAARPLARINWLDHAGDGSGRLYVSDMRGKIWVIEDGVVQPEPLLDVAAALGSAFDTLGTQVGLSTFAFHPDFASPGTPGYGKLYTAHSEKPSAGTPDFASPLASTTHHSVLSEWSLDPNDPTRIDPGSKRDLLRVAEPTRDHNIGQIAFNPNAQAGSPDRGLLYVAFGDGGMLIGGESDPARTAQDTSNPFGSILRIDPLGTSTPEHPTNGAYGIPPGNPFAGAANGALEEIYAYGFRNPHRFSWDTGGDGTLLISDIGQAQIEEIDVGLPGANYGWSEREGTFVVDHANPNILLPLPPDDASFGYRYPAAQYDHDEGAAIVGGFVYRGTLLPALQGRYIFGDLVNGRIFSVDAEDLLVGGSAAEISELTLIHEGVERSLLEILGGDFRADLRFGMDADGEIYVLTKRDGMIRRLVPEPGSGAMLALGIAGLAARRGRLGRSGRAARGTRATGGPLG